MNNQSFKDLFSTQSNDYAKFRPSYPSELFEYLSKLSTSNKLAWDCGTGNGQAAVELAKYFTEVIATDPSQKQLDQAIKLPNIHYHQATAENFNLDHSKKIDLVTVAQAFHWFNHAEFAKVISKTVRPQGHLAVWTYAISSITPEIDKAVSVLYNDRLNGYWEKERVHVEDGYKNISMPFTEITTAQFNLKAEWTLEHLIGYLSTWSALQSYIKKNGSNPLEKEFINIQKAWGDKEIRTITWPLNLRVWRI
jgi:ubiquinone/menaquinone biosynthesis C-methylase UbiE